MAGWSDVESINKNRNSVNFFKLNMGEKCIFRPLGLPHRVNKYMVKHEGRWRSAICKDPNNCPVANKHNILPKERWIINGIDRRDNSIRIFESSPFVFKQFKVFYDKTGKNPGGTEGANFDIEAINKKGMKIYKITFTGLHILTEDDMKLVEKNGLYDLKKLYAPTHSENIEKILFGDIVTNSFTQDKSINKKSQTQKEPINEKQARAVKSILSDLGT